MRINRFIPIIVSMLTAISWNCPSGAQIKDMDCAVNLKEAQSLYQAGKIEDVPALITGCISSGFAKEEKIQAYKLLINAYIFDNNVEKAEEFMLKFLQEFPEYEIVATDPNEFVDLMNQFDNRPRFSFGIMAGGNLSQIRTSETIGTHQTRDNIGNFMPSGIGFQAGFMFAKSISGKIELYAEAQYKQTVYAYELEPDRFTKLNFRENQSYIQFPVSFTYTFMPKRFSPYARMGFIGGLMLSSTGNLEKTFNGGIATPVSGEQIDLIDKRNQMNFWVIFGGGVKYKIPKGYLRVDLRYNFGLRNQVDRFSWSDTQSDLEWKYGYRDDKNIRDDLTFSFGYVRTIYNPRKK